MTMQSSVVDVSDPTSVQRYLKATPWGTARINGAPFYICPLCMAMMPAAFNNAHELPVESTPMNVHIIYHVAVARGLNSK